MIYLKRSAIRKEGLLGLVIIIKTRRQRQFYKQKD